MATVTIERICRNCGAKGHTAFLCPARPRKPLKAKKPMNKVGRRTLLYRTWRNTVAIPYLDKRYGRVCAKRGCTETKRLEVDHIKNRGSHPDLIMDVHNVQYLCKPHHYQKTYHINGG